jgi:hypothetical protein
MLYPVVRPGGFLVDSPGFFRAAFRVASLYLGEIVPEIETVTVWPAGWLTSAEAAARRGIDRRTIPKWVRAGLRVVRVVRGMGATQFAVDPDALAAFVPRPVGAPPGNQFAVGERRKKSRAAKR